MIDSHLRTWGKHDLEEVAREILNIGVKLLDNGDYLVTTPPTQANQGDVIQDHRGLRGVVESIHGLRLRFVTDDRLKFVTQEGNYDILRRIEAEPYVPLSSVGTERAEIVRQIFKRHRMCTGPVGSDSRVTLQSEIEELELMLQIQGGFNGT